MTDTAPFGTIDLNKLKLSALEPILESYIANLQSVRREEKYKWEAVRCFQDNWNPDVDDFASMLEVSLARANNLLTGYNYFPLGMLKEAAKLNPNFVKNALVNLIDGTDELRKRIEAFSNAMDAENSRNHADEIAQGKSIHSYQDTRAMSVYLTFAHPESFYLYKAGMFTTFAKALGIKIPSNKYDKLVYYYRLLDELLVWIEQKHPEITAASDVLLSSGLKAIDSKHHMLMQDIVYYAVDFITEKNNSVIDDEGGASSQEELDNMTDETADYLNNDNPNYWWICAKSSFFTWDSLEVGEAIAYTAFNDNGNKRRIFHYFEQARPGDLVVGYSTYPDKYVKCFGKVLSPLTDGCITVTKLEEVDNRVDYTTLHADPVTKQMEYIKTNPTGTIFKLTKGQYEHIYELAMKPTSDIEPYADKDFLNEVYLEEEDLTELKVLLERKKNLILQGAPGTGKTFAAKRLAYDIMGCKDDARIQLVQFHQSTTYDDFVCGFRPTVDGSYAIKNGVFVDFCCKARKHLENDYFFIIDEINRANIS